jgi:mannan endo-1,4-beta-mannosidase
MVLMVAAAVSTARGEPAATGFVRAEGSGFVVDGKPFRVAGANNHYLTFGSEAEVLRVLDDAVALQVNVLRTFLQPVIGSLDGSVPTIWDWRSAEETSNLGVNGAYMLYWDSRRGAMAVNDGPDGLQKLDFLLAEARKRNLRLLISFLDFWDYTGGAQQMRAWYGSRDQGAFFFRDERTRNDYRSWVRTVLERVNPLTGLAYKDEPAIFGWNLMNEPTARPPKLGNAWIAEMSAFVKSIDRNHLVGSGRANVSDRLSDLGIASIDFGTWHGYPKYYNLSPAAFEVLIKDFCGLAREHRKPVLLEEFGYARSNPDQPEVYRRWLDTIRADPDCAGWMVWRLVSRQDHGGFPTDEYDQFDIRNDGGPTWFVLKDAVRKMRANTGM